MALYIRTVGLASLIGLAVFAAVILTGPPELSGTRMAVAGIAAIATSSSLAWTIGRWSNT
ncbi:hypothetical protein DT019_03005 [Streptomyces sp. SDr-06]|uniref:hypothetical protein n=1 Tax=Streptomyces sp. SDr-06 TaxID=2267702 RepID=UPI000DEB2774|nr:hypothetical protein [Streptomyces sp. SDr-06]RCH70472.1 hypothetical protein DT019_03005 [Streptomyces sp. SDr-06]